MDGNREMKPPAGQQAKLMSDCSDINRYTKKLTNDVGDSTASGET